MFEKYQNLTPDNRVRPVPLFLEEGRIWRKCSPGLGGVTDNYYMNFILLLTLNRSLDHWLAPFEITSSTSLTPSSPRWSWTRTNLDEKNPTTCWMNIRKRWDSKLKINVYHFYHIYVLNDVLKSRMTPEGLEDAAFVQQGVHQIGTVDQLVRQTRVENF